MHRHRGEIPVVSFRVVAVTGVVALATDHRVWATVVATRVGSRTASKWVLVVHVVVVARVHVFRGTSHHNTII